MTASAWSFALRGGGTDTVELDIFDVVGETMWTKGVTAKDVRSQLKAAGGAKSIKVRINSQGGDIIDGLAIHNMLAEHGDVEIQIDGLAASMASVIAMAGDRINISAGAFVMIHNPWGVAMGESDDLRSHADLLDKMRDTLVAIYVARSGQTAAQVRKMMAAETWMSATEAKALGFVDSVIKSTRADKRASAQAFAALDPSAYTNLPAEIQSAIAGRNASAPLPPDGRTPDPIEDEEQDMTISKTVLAALNLPDAASEADALSAIASRSQHGALLARLESVTEAKGDEAIGRVMAWKTEAEKLPSVSAELAAVKAAAEKVDLAQLIASGRADKRLSKAEADKLESQVSAGEISLVAAKAFVAVMSPKSHMAATVEGSAPKVEIAGDGEAFAKLSGGDRHKMLKDSPEQYEASRADALAKGLI